MRQAINYAIDKEALVKDVLQGTATVADSIVPAAFEWAHDDKIQPYPHDPERARALLREAGAEGAELKFLVAEGGSGMLAPIPMATAIQADLAKVGLKVTIQTYEWNTYLGLVNQGLAGKGDMAEMAWMTNDPDTLPFLTLRTDALPESGGFNSGYYSNPEIDRLLLQARQVDRPRHPRRPLPPDPAHRPRGRPLGLRRQLEAERRHDRARQGLRTSALLPAQPRPCLQGGPMTEA